MKTLVLLLYLFAFSTFAQTETTALTDSNSEKIYRTTEVDTKPNLEEGIYKLSLFISENFHFPEDVKNKKVTIFSSFIIEPDGKMTDIKVFHVASKEFLPSDKTRILTEDEKINEVDQLETMKGETARVLKLFNKIWIPATYQGKAVRCLYNYPINFAIE